MGYQKFFNPQPVLEPAPERQGPTKAAPAGGAVGDRRDGKVYEYTDDIVLAVNIALATGRPLLVSGNPGSGKSSLAASVAMWMGWRYYEAVVTARTQARDLLWRFDVVRRLSDAQANQAVMVDDAYVEPGVLWWAFDRAQAERRGLPEDDELPEGWRAPLEPGTPRESDRAVVLIDEIDKADPDVPNSLLVALGSLGFKVDESGRAVSVAPERVPLIIITTNDERELPRAFLRRCVSLPIPDPPEDKLVDRLVSIAAAHFPSGDADQHRKIAEEVKRLGKPTDGSPAPSTAEYLDAVRAAAELELSTVAPNWEEVIRATLRKRVGPMSQT